MTPRNTPVTVPKLKFAALCALGIPLLGALIFWPAGRLDWVAGWVLFALMVAGWLATVVVMARANPELLTRRMSAGAGTKGWDRPLLGLMRLAILATLVVAGFDAVRYGWTTMSPWLWPLGLVLHVAGYALSAWSMGANAHFEGTVRIQTDRDHQVIDSGPYRLVRHPGYVGFALAVLAIPMLLGSWWSLVPAAATVAVLVVRTALEDATLRRELAGYADYAAHVRARLIPGLW